MSLTVRTVPVDKLHPNPWNPNAMNDRTYQAEKESIGRFGFVDPVTVRPHPELPDAFQIIDGEHRVRAAGELGMGELPIVTLDLGDAEAKKLTVVLNETRGEADTLDLARLLADIARTDPNVGEALPYSPEHLSALLEMADLEMPDYGNGSLDGGGDEDDEDKWRTLTLRVPAPVEELFRQAEARVAESAGAELHPDPAIRGGQVVEALLADYLAGPDAAQA